MQPVSPVIGEEFTPNEIPYGKGQEEYQVLPSIVGNNGARLSRWKPTDQERAAIAAGADIHLFVWCAFQPPVLVEVVEHDRSLLDTARFLQLVE